MSGVDSYDGFKEQHFRNELRAGSGKAEPWAGRVFRNAPPLSLKPDLTPSQQGAVRALAAAGGEGAIDRDGIVVAAGERLPFAVHTWLCLASADLVEPAGPNRIRLTEAGRAAAVPVGVKLNPVHRPFGHERVLPYPGTE